MDADGGRERTLTSTHSGEFTNTERDREVVDHPGWSPDSRRIAFTVEECEPDVLDLEGDCTTYTYTIGADGSRPSKSPSRLLERWSGRGSESPNGKWIASNCPYLCVSRTNGMDGRDLTSEDLEVRDYPAWSPDGRTIAFASFPIVPNRSRLYTIRPNGTGLRQMRLDWPTCRRP